MGVRQTSSEMRLLRVVTRAERENESSSYTEYTVTTKERRGELRDLYRDWEISALKRGFQLGCSSAHPAGKELPTCLRTKTTAREEGRMERVQRSPDWNSLRYHPILTRATDASTAPTYMLDTAKLPHAAHGTKLKTKHTALVITR